MEEYELKDGTPHILTFNEIKHAADRIEGGVIHTPLCEAKLSKYMDYNIYLKCENLQYTGRVVCILTGGNVSNSRLASAIDRGMAAAGRLVAISMAVSDAPGALARLLSKLTEAGADVKSITTERSWVKQDLFSISVNLVIETNDINHARELEKKLMKEDPHARITSISNPNEA